MANTDPFEVSKSIRPFARTIKVTEAAVARGRTGAIQHGYRPKTWAMNGKRTSITTDGDKENFRYAAGGGPTKAGGAVAVGATAGGAVAAKKKLKKNTSDPFEINKAEKGPFRRESFQNTRGENTKVSATLGAGMYGGVGAGLGAGVGAHEAKRGIRALDSIGAHPGKLRAAKLVAGHAGKGAAALGALGAVTGAGVGSVLGATSGSKGGKLGEFQRKQAIAGANKRAVRLDRKAAKARSRAQEFSKSAFGVEHPIEKAWKGTKGDKRNTKYAAAAVAGSQIGRRAGYKAAGTSQKVVDATARMHGATSAMGGESIKSMARGLSNIHGLKAAVVGDAIGTTAAAGAYHAYRKKKGIAKSAFGVEHDINKADRRMGGQAEWSGHLPKHTSGAVSATIAGQAKSALLPKAAAIRAGLKPVKMAARLK